MSTDCCFLSSQSGSTVRSLNLSLICFVFRCSSITFDLTDAEGYNRNRSKSRKRQKEKKEESQANIFAREDSEIIERSKAQSGHTPGEHGVKDAEDDVLSKWSCRKCTLENPLQEAVCVACGGSRLSSIGDIEVPRIVEPKNLVNLIKDDSDNNTEENNVEDNTTLALKWKCRICTLENEALNYYCDACNSPHPGREELLGRNVENEEGGLGAKMRNEDTWKLINTFVR